MSKHMFSRRSFIKGSTVAVASLGALSIIPTFAFARRGEQPHIVTKSKELLGTTVSITAVHAEFAIADKAVDAALQTIKRLETVFNWHTTDTSIAQLNRTGTLHDAPQELVEVILFAQKMYSFTNKNFDITVQPVLALLDKQKGNKSIIMQSAEFAEAKQLVGAHRLQVQGNSVKLGATGMGITLDGIAKGYIADQASASMKRLGVTQHLINAGGDIVASSVKANGASWSVLIENPNKYQANADEQYVAVAYLQNCAIATSGGYEKTFGVAENNKVITHLLNPATLQSPTLKSVSVISASLMQADALATALSFVTPQQAIGMLGKTQQTHCYVLDYAMQAHKSAHWSGEFIYS